MDWRDEGALLSVRLHGESGVIIEVFTAGHGRHAGVVPGGASRRLTPVLQPGTQLAVAWRARLDAHIGTFTVEPLRSRAGVLADRGALMALNSICALLHVSLPEREPHPAIYGGTVALLDRLTAGHGWQQDYLDWELMLLEELGYGLDLSECAVTGATDDLAFVSPRSGRAVSRSGAGDWADRLLPLPACLTGVAPADREGLSQGLRLTGHFLARLAADHGQASLPDARMRLVEFIGRSA